MPCTPWLYRRDAMGPDTVEVVADKGYYAAQPPLACCDASALVCSWRWSTCFVRPGRKSEKQQTRRINARHLKAANWLGIDHAMPKQTAPRRPMPVSSANAALASWLTGRPVFAVAEARTFDSVMATRRTAVKNLKRGVTRSKTRLPPRSLELTWQFCSACEPPS